MIVSQSALMTDEDEPGFIFERGVLGEDVNEQSRDR